jgi:hypothetical protein
MTMGTSGQDDRSEIARIQKRLEHLQDQVRRADPTAPCRDWILRRLNGCIARIEALKFVNQPMRKI